MERLDRANDVDQRIGAPDLVEVDLLESLAMHLGFGRGETAKDVERARANPRIDFARLDDRQQVFEVAVRRPALDPHRDLRRSKGSTTCLADLDADALEVEPTG
jgi:hypothetical protein